MPKPDFYIMTPRLPRQRPGSRNDFLELSRFAEELGYDRAWVMETNDRDAFSLATQMALGTRRIKVGTNIVSVFTRTPTLIAMSTLTISEVAGDRFILGIGPGGTEIVRDGHGIGFEKPLQRVSESIDLIRRLLRGERVTYNGYVFRVRNDFRLRFSLDDMKVSIYISALNPRMLQLAGKKADGVILSHMPLEAAEDAKMEVEKGCIKAGRSLSEVEICTNLPVGVNHNEGILNLRKAVAWHLAARTYDWLISHTPYIKVVKEMRKLWWSRRREEAAAHVTDDMLLTFGLGYKESDVKSRIKKYIAAGITPVVDAHGIRKRHEKEDIMTAAKVAIST